MLTIVELEHFVTFADCGTLSKASDILNISQPTLTRSMQHIEEAFGVPLFHRGKNKIELNQTGKKALEYSKSLLSNVNNTINQVKNFDRSLHTITLNACAPVPLIQILSKLTTSFSDMTLSSNLLEDVSQIIQRTMDNENNIGIIPHEVNLPDMVCTHLLDEHLYICVKPDHELSKKKAVTFKDINGHNFLLRTEIGFWNKLCREKMPCSKFLIQPDDFTFSELVRNSSLPCFATDQYNADPDLQKGRIRIPIEDEQAIAHYFILYSAQKKEYGTILLK